MRSSVTARLRSAALAVGPFKPSHITDSPDLPRTKIGPAQDHLHSQLLELYWAGVERDVELILRTLTEWRSEDIPRMKEEEDGMVIHGYETFLDQVCESERSKSWEKSVSPQTPYTDSIRNQAWEVLADIESEQRRTAARKLIGRGSEEDALKHRVRMLLQAAQWLDFDKIIEHREPLHNGLRLAPAQLKLTMDPGASTLNYQNVTCGHCHATIRGSMFIKMSDSRSLLCQNCYFTSPNYGSQAYCKKLKTCPLDEDITAEIGQKLCSCVRVAQAQSQGMEGKLFPMEGELGLRHIQCGLTSLDKFLAEAKFDSTRLKQEKNKSLQDMSVDMLNESNQASFKGFKTSGRLSQWEYYMPEFGSAEIHKEGGGTPPYFRPAQPQHPFGHVHMAVRFGTLVFENGVANTNGGVVVTTRNQIDLLPQDKISAVGESEQSLLLTGNDKRALYSQNRPRVLKRYKLIAKQVVGGTFCGYLDKKAEDRILSLLLEASEVKAESQKSYLGLLVTALKEYLFDYVDLHLKAIASRLTDTKFNLTWNFASNNGKDFCENLLDFDHIQTLFAPTKSKTSTKPAYLISFITKSRDPLVVTPWSKYDSPNGFVEEYLLRMQHGRHEDSDLIDSLSDYWSDFGAFEKPLYPNQDLFPWDCTEAYGEHHIKCGSCNISKHVWASPFDAWSIISMHLHRDAFLYAQYHPDITSAKSQMDRTEWFRNRLGVLLAHDSLLTAAAAMAQSPEIQKATQWLSGPDVAPDVQRLKLGSIHRAQPHSHHFDRSRIGHGGAMGALFVASWVKLSQQARRWTYEQRRDEQMKRKGPRQEQSYGAMSKSHSSNRYFTETPSGKADAWDWSRTSGNMWYMQEYAAGYGGSSGGDGGGGCDYRGGDSGGGDSGGGGGGGGGGDSGGGGCGGGGGGDY
ncbi:unnamed protein product [Clonostachys rosea]|uniref:Uncharacterized protein n=1 Tax=Bionectria ochroleuca TaxID=29856 RepID=A0ABY6UVM5_BIOOC|nr:unnamed protein product [Clonostachys rosea]